MSGQETSTGIDELPEAVLINFQGDPVTGGPPQFCEIYLQELKQVLSIKKKISPCFSGKGRGKGTIWTYTREHSSYPGLPSENTINQRLTDLGKGKYPTSGHSSSPVLLKGRGKKKTTTTTEKHW